MKALESRVAKLEDRAGGPDQRPFGVIQCWIDAEHDVTLGMAFFSIGPDWNSTHFDPYDDETVEAFSKRVKGECLSVHGRLPLAWEYDNAA